MNEISSKGLCMGKKIRLMLLLIVVFIVGGIAGLIVSQLLWMRNSMAPFYGIGLTEIAIDAQQLSQEKVEAVLKRKAKALPPLAQSYHAIHFKFMPDNNSRYNPLWQVQRYYEISGDEVPVDIKLILDSLPPRPLTSCELKRQEETGSAAENESEKD